MKALIPPNPDQLSGPFITAESNRFEVLSTRDRFVVVEFESVPEGVEWFGNYELMYCQRQHDAETIRVLRKATDEDRRQFRVPLWIQSEEVPECCGRPMFFVGQIDDNVICSEPPEGAKMWWHDAAIFYVFTCSQCMECKAVGQQF